MLSPKLQREKKKGRIFLDYASTTPVDPRVYDVMEPYFSVKFGNPSSLHESGQETRMALDCARESVAKFLGAKRQEIFFTSGATEANNFVLGSVAERRGREGKNVPHILVSAIEHASVSEYAARLERAGEIRRGIVPVTKSGRVDMSALKAALSSETVLVSIQYANSEIGVIQPMGEIRELLEEFRRERLRQGNALPLFFHSDAVQAANFLDCNVMRLGVDYLTLSGHKIYGPKGAGALFLRRGADSYPMLVGGFQEFGMRSGTENVPAIVGMGKAVELIGDNAPWASRVQNERDRLTKEILKHIPHAALNGALGYSLPNIANIYIPRVPGESLLIALDQNGIEVSLGTACSTRALKPSRSILALGYSKERARSSIRISLGKYTKKSDIDRLLALLPRLVATLRRDTAFSS